MNEKLTLSVDTSSGFCSVWCGDCSNQYYFKELETNDHVINLPIMVNEAIASVDRPVDRIIMVNGPGSFTGLRCTASLVLGLSKGMDVALYGISSFHAFWNSVDNIGEKVLVVLNSKTRGVYYQLLDKNGEEISEARYGMLEEAFCLLDKDTTLITNITAQLLDNTVCRNKEIISHPRVNFFVAICEKFYFNILPNYVRPEYTA